MPFNFYYQNRYFNSFIGVRYTVGIFPLDDVVDSLNSNNQELLQSWYSTYISSSMGSYDQFIKELEASIKSNVNVR